jgi:hypothetical protein
MMEASYRYSVSGTWSEEDAAPSSVQVLSTKDQVPQPVNEERNTPLLVLVGARSDDEGRDGRHEHGEPK